MQYSIQHISNIIGKRSVIKDEGSVIEYLSTDSRRIIFPRFTLFFALVTARKNAHDFIPELLLMGVSNFIVSDNFDNSAYPQANFIIVDDTLHALQQLAAYHRSKFIYPVIGITGSNGKTVVKEWLYQLLSPDYNIARSPRSYNSQIGVPLSVWLMSEENNLAIFEAGISEPGEMEKLESIIQPTYGVLTNLGKAHAENFQSEEQRLSEKLLLFKNAEVIIGREDHLLNNTALWKLNNSRIFSRGKKGDATLQITNSVSDDNSTIITAIYHTEIVLIKIPFIDAASVDNAITCWCVCLQLGLHNNIIAERMMTLQPVDMRLQIINGINNCTVINDSYNFDIGSFAVALDLLNQQTRHTRKTIVLSDIPGIYNSSLYEEAIDMMAARTVQKVIAIGERWKQQKAQLIAKFEQVYMYASTSQFLQQFAFNLFRNEAILLKGSRSFKFEKIASSLQQRVHQTVMEINLTAFIHNLNEYRRHLLPDTKIMAMVKAFAYGSGSAEIANVLQFHKADYLAVAYTDEGADLRRAGIRLPLMVMNIDEAAFETIIQYNLEPELYSLKIATAFNEFIGRQGLQQYPVHIKLETGMHRLGFEQSELDNLIALLKKNNHLLVRSAFSHFTSSDDEQDNDFTQHQFEVFSNLTNRLEDKLGYQFIKHIANSAGALRKPEYQLNMVRLGIGLYGIDPSNSHVLDLQNVATLKTTVAQLHYLKAGDTVGYNRRGKVKKDGTIATLSIGYADGFKRMLSNGKGSVFINGAFAPVIGMIAMDMTMADVTAISSIQEGEEAEIFGTHISVQQLAALCNTIPYEILTGISPRVKRVYLQEEL